MTREILIENIGPIGKLSIPLPAAGVVVLHGRNGVGKSHALAAVDSLVSGRGKPPCRDGAQRGVVEGFGAKLTIGRSTRRTGEAEVLTLEGRLDISQLVQPPIKDEESADRHRIKALIQLSGQPADATLFQCILPEGLELGELVPPSEQSDDPVVLAGRIKRALEAEARRWEGLAEKAQAAISVLSQEIHIDERSFTLNPVVGRIKESPDAVRAEAENQVAEALASLRELEAKQEMSTRQAEQIAKAKKALAELEETDHDSAERINGELANLDEKIRKLEQALAAARERKTQLQHKREEAIKRQEQIAQLRKVVDQEITIVSDQEIETAQRLLDIKKRYSQDMQELIHQVALWDRRAAMRYQLAEAQAHAEQFRHAANATEDVLSDMVGKVTKRLRIEDERLVVDTDRGVEPFGELSPGERWRIALEIAVEQLGQGGMVTMPQEAWDALDPVNRAEIAKIAKEVGVVILTAEASADTTIISEVIE